MIIFIDLSDGVSQIHKILLQIDLLVHFEKLQIYYNLIGDWSLKFIFPRL